MKKVSNVKRVIDFAKNSPNGFTVEDVKQQVKGVVPNSLYSLLWKLKKSGFLTHDPETHKYMVADASAIKLTAVNKTAKPKKHVIGAVPLPPKGSDEREIRELGYRVHGLKNQVTRIEGQYIDALAIIRYLEDKLFKAIQHDARNGSNS